MTTLYVDRRDAELDCEEGRLTVRAGGERVGTMPMRPLERLVVAGAGVRLSSRLLARLWQQGTSVVLLGLSAKTPDLHLAPRGPRDTALKLAQYEVVRRPDLAGAFAARIVRAKLRAQADLLVEATRMRGAHPRRQAAVERIETLLGRIDAEDRPLVDTLLGLEGTAARVYFEALATLFPEDLGFVGRNRRPPRDPVNACLSLGYTLLHNEAVRALTVQGFDVMLGLYHRPAVGRESLACDLAEPARSGVDAWVWRLLAERRLRPHDFSHDDARGCRLKKEGRQTYYRAWEETADRLQRGLDETAAGLAAELLSLRPDLPVLGQLGGG